MQPGRGDGIRRRVRRLFAFFVTEVARLRTLGNAPAARDHRHQETVQQLLRDVLREGRRARVVLDPPRTTGGRVMHRAPSPGAPRIPRAERGVSTWARQRGPRQARVALAEADEHSSWLEGRTPFGTKKKIVDRPRERERDIEIGRSELVASYRPASTGSHRKFFPGPRFRVNVRIVLN